MLKVDLVCPLYHANQYIEGFISRLKQQKNIEIVKAIFPITEDGDAESAKETESIKQKLNSEGYDWFVVNQKEFSHSLTREKAIYEYCVSDIVIMMSQDVVLTGENSIFELARHVNNDVGYVYGRQICPKKTIEHYTRLGNYGLKTYVVGKEDIEALQLRAFTASDAFAAYNREVFLKLNGYDHIHMMFNEDMYYVKKVLEAGYKKVYTAEAVAEHSHKMTLKQLYDRYYESGHWFKEHPEFDNYKTTDTGLALAVSVFKMAIRDFNLPVLARFVPDMLSRYMGMRNGKK